MGAVAYARSVPSFSERVQSLLDRVDYRLAVSEEEKDAIYRLRYDAYLKEGAIQPNFGRRLSDAYDDSDNGWIVGVHVDGCLVSSMRIHLGMPGMTDMVATNTFAEHVQPLLADGKKIIDPTRFVVDPAAARLYPELPYATVRIGHMATEYFQADVVLATVRTEHQAFYKRVFGHKVVCEARPYPTLIKPLSLMVLDYQAERERIVQRYPFFRSTFFERRALFDADAAATWRRVGDTETAQPAEVAALAS